MGGTETTVSSKRRLLASAAMIATGGGLAAIALHDRHWIEWKLLAFSALVAVAGVGLSRRSIASQVLSRGVAWLVAGPMLLVALGSLARGHVDGYALAFAGAPAAALLLARPMLSTKEARAEFAPSIFRRWFLAWSTASASVGTAAALFAAEAFSWNAIGGGLALAALSAASFASAVGVVRMRAWGVLLGVATSIATLGTAIAMHDVVGLLLAMASIPGFMLGVPIAASKLRKASDARVRVAGGLATAPERVRVATTHDGVDHAADLEGDLADVADPAPRAAARVSV
jgi:hypothetical protein